MTTYAMISAGCNLAVPDKKGRARICGADATTTRTIEGVTFSACDRCAAAVDTRNAAALATIPAPVDMAEDAADEEAHMGRKLRKAAKRGAL